MGEIIKRLTETADLESGFFVELNHATERNGPRYVHIQNERFRLNMTEQDFLRIAASLCKARAQLVHMKGLDKLDT